MLANAPPNLAAIADMTGMTGTEVVINLNVSDTDGAADQMFVFFDPDETPVNNATIDNATRTFHWTPTATQLGTFRFVILVTDRGTPGFAPLADAEEFTVTVAAANQPPVNTVPAAQTTAEDTNLFFFTVNNGISVSDPDAGDSNIQVTLSADHGDVTLSRIQGLTFTTGDGVNDTTLTFSGSIIAINAALDGLRFTPTADFSGAASITITTNDLGNTGAGGAKTDTDMVTINVTPVADTPSITQATTMEDIQASGLVISRNPADSVEVTHFKITNITNGTLFQNDGTTPINNGDFITFAQAQAGLRFTPAQHFAGVASFNVQASTSATDAGLGGTVAIALVTVLPVNDAPNLAPIANQTVARGAELVLTATATDADFGDTLTFEIDPDLAALGATIDPTTGVFRWTPSQSQPLGPVTIRILVIDSGDPALADSETFTVTVTDDNLPPSLTAIPDQTIAEGTELSFTATATDPNPGDVLAFSLVEGQFPAGATIDPQSGRFRWTPTENQGPGDHLVTIVVSDNHQPALTASRSFMVMVGEVNQPPALAAIANMDGTVGTPVTFTATATDPDEPQNTLTFSLQGAPAGATIDPQTGAFTWTPTAAGTVMFSVVVTDNGNPTLSAQRDVTINVTQPNQPPVLAAITNQSGTVGSEITFTASATDPENGNLAFSLQDAPAGASIDPQTGVFTWTPTTAGVFMFDVRVTDDGEPALFDEQEVTVTVSAPNQPPVLATIPDPNGTVGNAVTFTATATDPENGQLTFALDNRAPAGASIDPTTGAFTWTPTTPGAVTFAVIVTDHGDPPLSDQQDVTITVT